MNVFKYPRQKSHRALARGQFTKMLLYFALVTCTFVLLIGINSLVMENYIIKNITSKCATITYINRYSDFVKAESIDGTEYCFYGAKEYCIGDICSLLINTHGTKMAIDDELISHKNEQY